MSVSGHGYVLSVPSFVACRVQGNFSMSGTSLFEVPQQVALALSLASTATGADFDYLMKTAARESSFRPAAVARTSSARGLFQFIKGTWLRTLKEEGGKYGMQHLADQIFRTRSGRYYVPDHVARRKILKLRHDPKISALMAGAFTRSNSEMLAQQIGRPPTGGELYLAHFLGASDAVRMIKLKKSNPHWRADRAFPQAARANRSIFYDRKRARGVREVYNKLVRTYRQAGNLKNSSWSTHIVTVDAKAIKRARVLALRKRAAEKRAAAHAALPLPVMKPAAGSVRSVPGIQVADTGGGLDPIGALLRGSVLFLQGETKASGATLLTLN